MIAYDIVPISDEHIAGFREAVDFVAKERKYIVFFEAPPLEETKKYVHNMIKNGLPHFVVVSDGKVVGWCDVQRGDRQMHAHRGTLGIGLLPAFRGKGIGQKLLTKTIEAAFACGMTRIELTVKEPNKNALELYKKVGFEVEGFHKNACLIDGVYINNYSMAIVKAQ